MAGLGRTIPALPVRSAAEAVTFYRELGFESSTTTADSW